MKQTGGVGASFLIIILIVLLIGAGTAFVIEKESHNKIADQLSGDLQNQRVNFASASRDLETSTRANTALRAETEAALEQRNTRILALDTAVNTAKADMAQQSEQSAATKQRLDDEIATLSVSLDQTRQAQASIEQEHRALTEQHQQAVAAAQQQQQQATEAIANLKQQAEQAIAALEQEKAGLEQNLTALEAQREQDAAAHQTDRDSLLAETQTFKDALRAEKPEVAAQLEGLLGQISSLNSDLETTSQAAAIMQAELEQSNAGLTADLDTTRATLDQTRTEVAAALTRYDQDTATLKQEAAAALEAASQQQAEMTQAHGQEVQRIEGLLDHSINDATTRIEALEAAHAKAASEAAAVLAQAQNDAAAEVAALTQAHDAKIAEDAAELQRTRDQAATEIATAGQELSALEQTRATQVAALESELGTERESATQASALADTELTQALNAGKEKLAIALTAAAATKVALEQDNARSAAAAAEELAATKRSADATLAKVRAEAAATTAATEEYGENQLAACKATHKADSEAMHAAASAEIGGIVGELRNCLLNGSALASVYEQRIGTYRQAELDALGATRTDRGLVISFGEAELSFASGQAVPRAATLGSLDPVVAYLTRYAHRGVLVEGHTDSRGSDAINQSLSEQRAAGVRDALIDKGIAGERISTRGYGETQPIADNETRKGRSQNRRVEIVILDQIPAAAPVSDSSN